MVHSRNIELKSEKVTLEFGHEGVLYKKSFIMYDKRTDSKWNHSTGLAMAGKLAGTVLKILPSRVMRWKSWKQIYPNTKVLAREGRGGFMGTYVADRYASELGLSVGQGPNAKLYPFDLLLEKPVVNDVVGPYSILVVMDAVNKQAMAFSRKVSDRVLTFKPIKAVDNATPLMRDQETGSVWNRLSGRAIEGPLKGAEVLPLISVPWLKERWRSIHEGGLEYPGS